MEFGKLIKVPTLSDEELDNIITSEIVDEFFDKVYEVKDKEED